MHASSFLRPSVPHTCLPHRQLDRDGPTPTAARCRGSDKAFKYLKARFTQSHVKVQNLSLLVRPLATPDFSQFMPSAINL